MSFWWPAITDDVREYCGSCKDCQLRRMKIKFDRVPIRVVVPPDETFEVMNCDVIGPAEYKSARGYAHVMVVIDQFSRWLEAIPSRILTAKAAYDVFLEVFACTDIPKVLVCDNAINFTAALITEFKKRLGVYPVF